MIFVSTETKERNSIIHALNKAQAVIHFDLDGKILWANENFLNAMGYRLEEIKGQHHRMFVDPVYERSPEYRQFWDDLRSGKYQEAEYKRFGKGGKEVWIQAIYNPLLDEKGRPFKVVKFATDITARKLQNADYQGQISAIGKSQAVIHFDLSGKILWANENFLNALGYSLDEIKGRHHRMFVDPVYERTAEYTHFWDSLRRGEFQAAEYKRLGKGGKEIWIQASYNPIFDMNGNPFKVVKYATDITAQVEARAEALRVGKLVDDQLEKIVASTMTANQQSSMASSASAETASTVQTVAAGAEELSSSIREISHSMTTSKSSVEQAKEQMGAADQAAQNLSKTSAAMTSVVEFIQDIAGQINLLALNATIESARAGDAGKGFAVVASEVKNLANQVATATSKISSEIDNMQNVSGNVVKSLEAIKTSIDHVQSSITGVAGAVEQQSAVTREISANMQNAATAVDEMNRSLSEISSSITTANDFAKNGMTMYRNLQKVV